MRKGVNALVWNMFENSGFPGYYLLYAAVINGRERRGEPFVKEGTIPREEDARLR